MPRPPKIIKSLSLHTALPEDLRARLDLYLWSDAQRCIPRGAYQAAIVEALREWLDKRTSPLDQVSV